MNSFKSFFTEADLARGGSTDIGPANPTLNDFFKWLVSQKATTQSIIDLGAFDLGTNRSFKTVTDLSINSAVDFHHALTKFVNRDQRGRGPSTFRDRVYDSEEFRNKHNYAEYRGVEKLRNQGMRKVMQARRNDNPTELDAAQTELDELKLRIRDTEYSKAYSKAYNAENEYVEIMQNTPFDINKLSNDGSEEYKLLDDIFNNSDFDINVYLDLIKTAAENWKSVRSGN